jgi:hypothetical protein
MAVPWLRVLDTVIGVADIARTSAGGRGKGEPAKNREDLELTARTGGGLEARLAGVVVAALKEAFDRDTRRLDLERQQIEAQRDRAERALQLELRRQAGDREIGRLRLLAGAAGTAWIGTMLMSARLAGGLGARVTLGVGWAFLLGAIAVSFTAQSRVAQALDAIAGGDDSRRGVRSGAAGAFALWLMICGLLLAGLAALIA